MQKLGIFGPAYSIIYTHFINDYHSPRALYYDVSKPYPYHIVIYHTLPILLQCPYCSCIHTIPVQYPFCTRTSILSVSVPLPISLPIPYPYYPYRTKLYYMYTHYTYLLSTRHSLCTHILNFSHTIQPNSNVYNYSK